MNRILGAAVKIAASVAIAGGTILATTMPASAATPNEAYGAAATGPIGLLPVALATPTNTAVVASNANLAGFLATGTIVDRATVSSAFSRVNSPVVTLSDIMAQLSATYVTSSCRVFGTFTLARSDIYNGSIVEVGDGTIPLPENPAPNTVITIDGVTITLNMQSTLLGVTTVTAIYITDGSQTLSLGVTQCNGLLP